MKAVITIAGNPVLSAPDGERLSRALDGIDFMLSVDPYLNETTRHADVILPPPPPSQSAHFDFALNNVSVRNNARYSPPVLPLADGRPDEPEILSRLALILYGSGPDADPAVVDDQVIATTLTKETADPASPVAGRAVDELTAMLDPGPGYERRLDMMLRLGPYGDAFGANPDGLTLERLKNTPHGIDFGPLQPRAARGVAHPIRQDRARARRSGGRRGAATRLLDKRRTRRRWLRADRSSPPALQQQLDAQSARPRRRHQPLHAADPPRRRRGPRPHRYRACEGSRWRTRCAGGGHRRHPPRRCFPAARLGSRPQLVRGSVSRRARPASTSTSSTTVQPSTRYRAPRC